MKYGIHLDYDGHVGRKHIAASDMIDFHAICGVRLDTTWSTKRATCKNCIRIIKAEAKKYGVKA